MEEERPLKRLKPIHNCYAGYCLSDNEEIDCLEWKNVGDAKQFFDLYVKQRKPVKIQGALQDSNCDLHPIWKLRDIEYLKTKAGGKNMIHVEKRLDAEAKFGRARHTGEVVMPFQDFLSLEKSDRHLYYLTTQPIETDEEGRPHLMSEPVSSLQDEFALRPKLAGNLIPMNYNLWMGCSSKGSTSGLHHDFHDNFYCLLRGRKRFTLYSPNQADKMDTRGTIDKVFENGLIHYQGEPTVCGDGVQETSLKAWEADVEKEKCEQALANAEAAVEAGKGGSQEALEKAEAALEAALDKVLAAEMQDDDIDNESNGDENTDFWSNIDKNKNSIPQDDKEEPQEAHEEDNGTAKPQEKMNNFSRIESKSPVPGIPFAQVTLEKGELLYLPAGWFHEVSSYSDDSKGSSSWHMAFNYWFHPPTSSNFDNPYPTRFWQSDWEQRMENISNKD